MTALILSVVACQVVVLAGASVLRVRIRSGPARQRRRFEAAAEEARRMAQDALIVEASMAELAELVIEQCLAEIGMGVAAEPI